MTANKRRKNKIAAEMEASGTNYLRAARDTTSALKDSVNLTWSPGVDQSTGKKYADEFTRSMPHLRIASGMSEPRMEHMVQDVVFQLIQSNHHKDVQLQIVDIDNVYGGESWLEPFKDAPHVSHFFATDAHHYGSDTTSEESASQGILRMLEDLRMIMAHRANLFSGHHDSPRSLERARALAVQESLKFETPLEDHPLHLPYIFLVVTDMTYIRSDNQRPTVGDFERHANMLINDFKRIGAAFGIYFISGSSNALEVDTHDMKMMSRHIFMKMGRLGSQYIAGDDSLHELSPQEAIVKSWGKTSPGLRITRNASRTSSEIKQMVHDSL